MVVVGEWVGWLVGGWVSRKRVVVGWRVAVGGGKIEGMGWWWWEHGNGCVRKEEGVVNPLAGLP